MAERLIPSIGLVADQTDGEQNLIPGGGLVQEATGAPPAGPDVVPLGHQRLDNQYSAIAASRLNGVLQ